MKVCKRCGEEKPESDYYHRKDTKDGLQRHCKSCQDERLNRYHRETPEKSLESSVKWQQANIERLRELQRKVDLKRFHGITPEEYNRLFEQQKGCCAICGKHQTEFKRNLAVDHNHSTGENRGLLCSQCNMGLGFYYENEQYLVSALVYLRKYAKNNT